MNFCIESKHLIQLNSLYRMGIVIILLTLLIGTCIHCQQIKSLEGMWQVLEHTDKIQNQQWSVTVKGSAMHSSVTKPICFTIPSYQKSKKKAYDLLQRRMRKIKAFFSSKLMICDSSQSIQSMAKSVYLNKKRVWFFEKTVLVLAEPQFVQDEVKYLRKMGIFQVQCQQNFQILSKQLRHKINVLKALQNAKDQLRELISQYPFLEVDDIDKCSIEYTQKWGNPSDYNKMEYLKDHEGSNYEEREQYQEDNVQMEVVFQIKYDDDQQKVGLCQMDQDQEF